MLFPCKELVTAVPEVGLSVSVPCCWPTFAGLLRLPAPRFPMASQP